MDLYTAIRAINSEKNLEKSMAKGDMTIPNFSGGVYFPSWVDGVRNDLGAHLGVSGIPLDFIIRAIMDPDAFINYTQRLQIEAAHVGDHFQRDNVELFKLLQSTMDHNNNSGGCPHIKGFERTQDSRDACIALTQHYGAGGERKKQIEMAKATLKAIYYQYESILTFNNFSTKLSDSFHVLETGLEGYTETQKVDALIELIHNKDNGLLMHVDTIRSTISDSYTCAVQLLCNMVVKIFPQAHQQAGGCKRRQRVGGLVTDGGNKCSQNVRGGRGYGGGHQGRGQGRGRGRGCGRGGGR